MRIDTNLAESVIVAVARQLGFRVMFDRRPDVDEWTLSSGHGTALEEIIGTRASISAFLEGYANMHGKTIRMLDELEHSQRNVIDEKRAGLSIRMLDELEHSQRNVIDEKRAGLSK